MNSKAVLTDHLIDIALGLYVYTYPKLGEEELKAHIQRPWGFQVHEVINGIDLGNIVLDSIARQDISTCNEGYVYVVEKMNIDSNILCTILKELLRCSTCETLGLKDTRAIVRQIAILRSCSSIVKKVENSYEDGYFKAVLWQCSTSVIHSGNKFLVDISIESSCVDVIKKRFKVMENHGFVFLNFFGYQRFGTLRPVTHVLGKLLVKREWDLFLDTLCRLGAKHKPQTLEHIVCSLSPRYRTSLEVIKRIPRTYLVFYINAYQSYIFNVVLSKLWLKLVENQGLEKAFDILKDEYRYIPVIGSRIYTNQNDVREIIEEILEVEGIQSEDFNIKSLGIEIKGGTRRALERAYDVVVQFKDNKVALKFVLNRGCYATIFLRELLKIDPLAYV